MENSVSYVVRELQIKATMRHHPAPIKRAKIQNTDDTSAGCEAAGNPHSLLMGIRNVTANLEDSLAVSYEAEHAVTVRLSNCIPPVAFVFT